MKAVFVFLAFALAVFLCVPALAQEVLPEESEAVIEAGPPDTRRAIELTGERLIYHPADDEITAINGIITYQDFTLQANLIRIYLDREELIAEGNVIVEERREGSLSREVTYNWGKETWRFTEFETDITGRGIEGVVFFRGENVFRDPDITEVEDAFLTTCDLDEPHYHIEARKVEIYPDHLVVIHGFSYHDFDTRFFTLPHYVIFLDRREQLPLLPVIGQSSALGWYATLYYTYYFGPESFGTVTLDWWEKRGWGLGIRHFYEPMDRADRGELTLGYQALRDQPDPMEASLSYRGEIDDKTSFTLSLDYSGEAGEISDRYTGRLAVVREDELSTARLTTSFDSDIGNERDNLLGTLDYRHKLGDVTGRVLFDYTRRAVWGESIDEVLRTLVSFDMTEGDYTYALRYETYEDLREDMAPTAVRRHVYKMPELEVSKRRTRIGESDFRYRAGLLWGYYREMETGVEADRLRLWADIEGRHSLGPDTSLRSTLLLEQDFYEWGDYARYMYAAGLRLTHNFTPDLSINLDYSKRDYDGATPFRFDYTTRQADTANIGIQYRTTEWDVSLRGGYDFIAEDFSDGDVRVRYRFDPDNTLSLRGRYDFDTGEWRGLVLGFDTSFSIDDDWKVSFDGSWDLMGGGLQTLQVGVTRDLHCREIRLVWDRSRDTFWLEYTIKAFPTETFVLGG